MYGFSTNIRHEYYFYLNYLLPAYETQVSPGRGIGIEHSAMRLNMIKQSSDKWPIIGDYTTSYRERIKLNKGEVNAIHK